MENVMKIVESLSESGLLIQGITEPIKNETKEQTRRGFFPTFLGVLAGSILGNAKTEWEVIRADEGTIRVVKVFNATQSFT